jgi:hypothetical protein
MGLEEIADTFVSLWRSRRSNSDERAQEVIDQLTLSVIPEAAELEIFEIAPVVAMMFGKLNKADRQALTEALHDLANCC